MNQTQINLMSSRRQTDQLQHGFVVNKKPEPITGVSVNGYDDIRVGDDVIQRVRRP